MGEGLCKGGGLTQQHPLSRRGEPATEHNPLGLAVLDEEKEGVVCTEVGGHALKNYTGGGSRSLCALLIDLHKGLMHNLGQRQALLGRYSRKVCPALKGIGHAQLAQEVLHVIILLQLKPWEENLHLFFVHHIQPRPLCEFLISYFLFHLEES